VKYVKQLKFWDAVWALVQIMFEPLWGVGGLCLKHFWKCTPAHFLVTVIKIPCCSPKGRTLSSWCQ